MVFLETALGQLTTNPIATLSIASIFLVLCQCVYRCTFHPLAHIPGPLLAKLTSLWLYYHAYIGDEATVIHEAHKRYGPLVRVSPREVDIADADAIAPIYISKGGFPKAPCYANFDIDGHKTIFSTEETEYRAPRAKSVMPLFSTKSIKDNEAAIYSCVDDMVRRMQEEARTAAPVNILNLTRSLALDVVSTHLFRENYNGTSEKGGRLSASAFVDAYVAVGRFFYLSNTVFSWLSWTIDKYFSDERTEISMGVVDKFVRKLVESTPKDAQNYPGRMLNLGLSKSEVMAQCKDLMFAGTDSTGPRKQDIQGLPYLSAVVKEGLRISMANPTRLPHIVPPGGWAFKSTYFPPGSIVGCSAYELHFNPDAFPSPFKFHPERWLEGEVTSEANKHWFAFGAGSRACIARNLATIELYMALERLVQSDVLHRAKVCQDEVELYEWFNASVKGEKIELIWS
ncbi:cytochrome P450 protein [Rutstroemia sp. NJR-2017a WRK4]|nr:cytochrome P450 protein [Rutstroemia sp. NJR-2017a WRK4]